MASPMPLKQVKPNKWYFVVDCAKCRENIPFLEAPSPEEQPDIKQRTIALRSIRATIPYALQYTSPLESSLGEAHV
jgi:hypothetical protein